MLSPDYVREINQKTIDNCAKENQRYIIAKDIFENNLIDVIRYHREIIIDTINLQIKSQADSPTPVSIFNISFNMPINLDLSKYKVTMKPELINNLYEPILKAELTNMIEPWSCTIDLTHDTSAIGLPNVHIHPEYYHQQSLKFGYYLRNFVVNIKLMYPNDYKIPENILDIVD